MTKPTIKLVRVYDDDQPSDGYRVLVDRLWPRGVSKQDAALDDWPKELAPSDELRERFHDGELNWSNFKKAYKAELRHGDAAEAASSFLEEVRKQKTVVLLFGSKDEEHNNAVALKEWLGDQL